MGLAVIICHFFRKFCQEHPEEHEEDDHFKKGDMEMEAAPANAATPAKDDTKADDGGE